MSNNEKSKTDEFMLAERLKSILTDQTVEGVKWIVHVKPVIKSIQEQVAANKSMPMCCKKEIAQIIAGTMMKYCYKPGP